MSELKEKVLIFAMVCLLSAGICGCAANTVDVTDRSSVRVFSDGHLEAEIVEKFDQDYYNEAELMEMVQQEITEYNLKKGGEPIKLLAEELENQLISMELSFETAEDYNAYMPDEIFAGTVNDAYQEGYDFNRSLTVVGKDGATIGKKDLLNMAKHKLIILNGNGVLRAPSKIMYYSQDMNLLDGKTVEAEEDGVYFVIYK